MSPPLQRIHPKEKNQIQNGLSQDSIHDLVLLLPHYPIPVTGKVLNHVSQRNRK